MSTAVRPMTAEELAQWPDHHHRHELVKGELRTMPFHGAEHGFLAMNLAGPLAGHVSTRHLGAVFAGGTGFILARDPDTVRAPALAFIRQARIAITGIPTEYWRGAPDLAVEVLSPEDRVSEVNEKVPEWLAAGTRLVWVINPRQQTVTVHHAGASPVILTTRDSLDGQDVVPGLLYPVVDIFG